MAKLAFITDIHFGRQFVGLADKLAADLNAYQPDVVLIGGDITQRGLGWQYRQCEKFLSELKNDWFCVIGNHDVPAWNLLERFTRPYHAYQHFITRDLNPTWVNETVAVQGINSARRMMRDWAWEQGAISDWQIEMTQTFFAKHSGKTKIVVVHHPLTHPPERKTRLLVRNHEKALRGFAEAGVDVICTGHLHRYSVQDVAAQIPGCKKPLWALHGGTATSDRLRAGETNSYWEIEINGVLPTFILRNM